MLRYMCKQSLNETKKIASSILRLPLLGAVMHKNRLIGLPNKFGE